MYHTPTHILQDRLFFKQSDWFGYWFLLHVLRGSGHFLSEEDARDELEYQTAEDDEAEDNEPEGRDGRLELLLGPLLDVGLRLATTSVLLLDELGVPLSLL